RMVLRQGAVLALGGILVGLGVGLAAAQALRSTLYGVSAADPVTLIFAALLLGGTTLAACYLPARRAASVDPARTLGDS
ncbi:MAG TPA: FtsX-like permease family protein, partial [Gemmatimonadales bacterium]|nr:FtsX-like permease family protein [Gemmatimonadales bacterium]